MVSSYNRKNTGKGGTSQNRHSYIKKLKSGEKALSNARDAKQVFKILSRDYGIAGNSKRLVLNFDDDMVPVLREATELLHPDPSEPLKLLEALGDEALTQGVYKDRSITCFKALYEAEEFFPNLALRLIQGNLTGPNDHSTIAWFLLQLGITGNETLLSDPDVLKVIDFLNTSQQVGFPKLSEQLAVVFYKSRKLSAEDGNLKREDGDCQPAPEDLLSSLGAARNVMRQPGVRDHDNDKTNFRAISIVPTTSELACSESPYLPSPIELISNDVTAKEENIGFNSSTKGNANKSLEALALDRQFRLMREDLIGTVKEELRDEWKMPSHKRRLFLTGPSVIGFGSKPEPHVVVQVPLPLRLSQRLRAENNSKAIEFFEKGPGKRVLQKGTLVVLVTSSNEEGDKPLSTDQAQQREFKIKAVGTVVERLKPLKIVYDENKRGRRVLQVGISFTPESMRFLTPLFEHFHAKKKEGLSMVAEDHSSGLFNASAGLFSLEPILKALQGMDKVPMSDQLIHLRKPKQPELPHGGKNFDDLDLALRKAVSSDKAQKRALEEIFRSNVVLVQGPPGTGKTYIGVQMVKAMLNLEGKAPAVSPLRILCLCYTNHALDSFLLDLIDAGISETFFVRLGSSPKIDPKIQRRCLGEINSTVNNKFGRNESAAYGAIKRESETLEEQFKGLMKDISKNSTWGSSLHWWNIISIWMEDSEHYEKLDELRVPSTSQSDGFVKVGANGKALKSNYLWKRWFGGKNKGIFHDQKMPQEGLWKLDEGERKLLIQKWQQEWIQPKLYDLEYTIEKMKRNTEALRALRRINDLKALKNAKIIGCTTVAAAKFQGMINPSVVIVEEAGEILESHVLANLGDSCQQLIMIGDHKQLRPKIENYSLQKESGHGFDLNVSLFERLVTSTASCIPVFPLTVQHRMRPEISRIIRGMALYESLEDHENTKGRKSVAGITNDVVFLDHRFPEKADEATAAVGMETKVNPFEVNMVVSIAKYIIQQGQYSPEQITILTPYLGQLALIRKKLEETKIGSFVSDQDFGDLARQNLTDNVERQRDSPIRIATIDNFQGEESEVVIISLVRSNPQGARIGFLCSEERINVLFSRAREGMYIVGNLKSLSECSSASGRRLWSNLKDVFEKNKNVYDYFPAKCQKHQMLHNIQTPEDFVRLAPEGGCALRCTLLLDCGHQCPKKCHRHVQHVHSLIQCKEKVEDVCSNGHKQLRECYSTVKCTKIMEWFCSRGHSINGRCWKGRPKVCKMCDKLDKLEEEIERKREDLNQEIRKQKEQLMLVRAKLAAAEDSKESEAKLSMIVYEQKLLDERLSNLLARQDHDAKAAGETTEIEEHNLHAGMNGVVGGRDSGEAKETIFHHQLPQASEVENIYDEIDKNENEGRHSADNIKKNAEDRDYYGSQKKDELNLSDRDHAGHSDNFKMAEIFAGDCLFKTKDDSISSADRTQKVFSNPNAISYDLYKDGKKPEGKPNKAVPHNISPVSSPNPNSLFNNPDFCDALVRFKNKKFLEADDLIDSCMKTSQSEQNRKTLNAFRCILYNSLDPFEKHHVDADIPDEAPKTFEAAIRCWARFVAFASSDEFPSITIKTANFFLSYRDTSNSGIAQDVIQIGRNQAKDVIEKAEKKIRSSLSQKPGQESEVERAWTKIRERDPSAPSVVNEVMMMIGLFHVKEALIGQYHQIKISQRQGDASVSSYNVRFEGNPGTGKTTVARYYSTFLQQLAVLPKTSITLEVTAASLKNKGISHLEDMLKKVKKAGGGVIFVDEAYQLSADQTGEKLLDFILPISESLDGPFGKLVWIFAGYPKEMEKLFEHNYGLPSRFPQQFRFADYDAVQMEAIFRGFMEFKEKSSEKNLRTKMPKQKNMARNYNRLTLSGRKIAFNSTNGETYVDRFGNSWTCNSSEGLWRDGYGNTTGYHPSDIGDKDNPLACSEDNLTWTHDGEFWISSRGESQKHYPGSPNPSTKSIGKKERRESPFKCENDKFLRIAMRRLERQSNRPGFGNARAVRNLFDSVRVRQAKRLTKENQKGRCPDDFNFTRDDLLGVALTETQLKKSQAYQKLQKMEGLKPVKEQIDDLIRLGESNLKREESERPLLEIILNRIFLGNPGTGKTTVAKLYGQLLVEMGLLSKGEVIIKNPSDFKGDVLGSSEKNTRDILRAAEGNVLVIDEAYALCSSNGLNGTTDPYGNAVIDTLVEQIQARPGDDRAVVMLGYRKEMENMFKNVNPGLSRRFQLEQAFVFPDYNDDALVKILFRKAKECSLKVTIAVAKRAVRSLARARAKPNFGNAGAVDSLLSQAKERLQKRDGTSNELTLEDFAIPGNDELNEEELSVLFAGLVGMEDVREKIDELKNVIQFAKARGEDPKESICFNYLFLGNPGTGKTTVARCMGKMFKILGLLPDDTVYECTPKDFTTGFAGQSGSKTAEQLQKSRGGVLFIDEAYQLNPRRGGPYMTEVVDELVAKLTDEEFKGKILVLLAGYDADMNDMLNVNPGLKSRFAERIFFNDLTGVATRDLLVSMLASKKIPLPKDDAESDALLELATRLAGSREFANGRDVATVCDKTYAGVARRSGKKKGTGRGITAVFDDVREAVNGLLLSREQKETGLSCSTLDFADQATSNRSREALPSARVVSEHRHIKDEEQEIPDEEPNDTEEVETTNANPFGALSTDHLKTLNDIVDEMRLNTQEGIQQLLSASPKLGEEIAVLQKLMERLDISEDAARGILKDWKKAHAEAKRQKLAIAKKSKGMEAIWHCSVCGRGGRPRPICYVAPYISGYRPISVG